MMARIQRFRVFCEVSMKIGLYDPVNGVLLDVRESPFHHRDLWAAVPEFVARARRVVGSLPGVALCVWDESSLRVFPFRADMPPTFDEVATACGRFGYVAG